MNRSIACLRSYVAAWWMKVIAGAIVLAAGNAAVFLSSTEVLEPAWPHPQLVSWVEIDRLDATSLASIEGLALEPNFFSLPVENVRSLVRRLPRLHFCRVEAPRDVGQGPQAAFVNEAIAALFRELAASPTVESVEIAGVTPVTVLQHLQGSENIRHLYTSALYSTDDAGADGRLAALVDTVATFPRLAVWGLSMEAAVHLPRLDAERLSALRAHPTLRTLLLPPRDVQPGSSLGLWCKKIMPSLTLGVSHVDRGRLSGAWGILAATMFVAGLVVMSVASMLVLSAAAVVPEYAETHRRVGAGVLAVVTAFAAVCLWRMHVAVAPALLWAALATLIPAATLEWDRRKSTAGVLVIPTSLAWCLGFLVPLAMIGRGEWWVWQDRFLASNVPTATTWAILVVDVALAVTAWKATGGYAQALSSHGRVAAVTSDRRDVWRQLSSRSDSLNPFKEVWGSSPVRASRAVRADCLSNIETPASRRRLLVEGMMTVPFGRLVVHGVVLVVLGPLFMRLTVPAFRENPQLLAIAFGAIALTAVWFRPLVGWNERAPRVAGEIGTLLPRPLYVAAVRGVLARQMLVPMATLFGVLGGAMVYRGGAWWLLGPLAGVTVAAAVITVSTVELMLTVRSTVLNFFIMFGIAYPAVGAGAVSISVLFNVNAVWPGDPWIKLVPFAVLAVMAVVLRLWMNRRLKHFEFGRLV